MAKNPKQIVRDPENEALRAENAELHRKLGEAERHRHLLIEALHGLTKQVGAAGSPALGASIVTVDSILEWLVNTIQSLTASRPVEGQRSLGDLLVPIPRLVKVINSKWFPNGGGYTDIDPTTTVGDLAESIYLKLQQ